MLFNNRTTIEISKAGRGDGERNKGKEGRCSISKNVGHVGHTWVCWWGSRQINRDVHTYCGCIITSEAYFTFQWPHSCARCAPIGPRSSAAPPRPCEQPAWRCSSPRPDAACWRARCGTRCPTRWHGCPEWKTHTHTHTPSLLLLPLHLFLKSEDSAAWTQAGSE